MTRKLTSNAGDRNRNRTKKIMHSSRWLRHACPRWNLRFFDKCIEVWKNFSWLIFRNKLRIEINGVGIWFAPRNLKIAVDAWVKSLFELNLVSLWGNQLTEKFPELYLNWLFVALSEKKLWFKKKSMNIIWFIEGLKFCFYWVQAQHLWEIFGFLCSVAKPASSPFSLLSVTKSLSKSQFVSA